MDQLTLLHALQEYKEPTGTNLITLLVPGTANLSKVNTKMQLELATAVNIKDRQNRLAVCSNLKSLSYALDMVKTLPPTGICLFAGNMPCF